MHALVFTHETPPFEVRHRLSKLEVERLAAKIDKRINAYRVKAAFDREQAALERGGPLERFLPSMTGPADSQLGRAVGDAVPEGALIELGHGCEIVASDLDGGIAALVNQ